MSEFLVHRINDIAPGFVIEKVARSRSDSDKNETHLNNAKQKSAVVFLHAFGGCKEEIAGLALNVANDNSDCFVYDMPGHGENEENFDLQSVEQFINNLLQKVSKYCSFYFVGHSVGAIISLNTGAQRVVAISPPGESFFEGKQSELIQTIRVRRVKEEVPFAGLKAVLSLFNNISPKIGECLVLYAKNEIRSSREKALHLGERKNFKIVMVPSSNHLDIISSRQAFNEISGFLWD